MIKLDKMKGLEGLPEDFIEWVHERPKIIQEAIIKMRPDKLYKIKSTKEQCYIVSYSEPDTVDDEITVTVQKTGEKDCKNDAERMIHEINGFADFQVFGLKLDDLEEWK